MSELEAKYQGSAPKANNYEQWGLFYPYETTHTSTGPKGNYSHRTTLKYIAPKITVGLDLAPDGHAQRFVGRYYRDRSFENKELRTPADREALVQMLVDLHQPSQRAEMALAQDLQICTVLGRLSSIDFPRITDGELRVRSPEWMSTLKGDSRIDPSNICKGSLIGSWELLGYSPSVYDSEREGYTSEKYWPIISVYIVVGDNGAPVRYEYEIAGMDGTRVASLEKEALFAALERSLRELSQKRLADESKVQTKSSKKRWFGW